MPETSPFAYSLSQVETGWRWTIFDEDGETVAVGAHDSLDAARAAVERTIKLAIATTLRLAVGANGEAAAA